MMRSPIKQTGNHAIAFAILILHIHLLACRYVARMLI